MTAAAPRPVDLTDCDREPSHIPGSVQPHGALLGFRSDGALAVASANARAILGVDVVIGMSLPQMLGDDAAHALSGAADDRQARPVLLEGRPFEAVAHTSGGVRIVELEAVDTAAQRTDSQTSFATLRGVILRLSAAPSVVALCDLTAREIRQLTGFDRVMVHRFDAHGNGEVVAEAREPQLNPFLGLHYPATDIPEQARALYLANWIRLIADVGCEPVPLVPADVDGVPVDLSHAALRSASPIHVEYLTNMGVAASMSISLIDQGRLWGLVACHHHAGPHRPPAAVRAAAEFLGQVVSLLLVAKERSDSYERTIAVQRLLAQLSDRLAGDSDRVVDQLQGYDHAVLGLVAASGAALHLNGTWTTMGTAPGTDDLGRLTHWLADRVDGVWSTDSLGRDAPEFEGLADVASGVLAAQLSAGAGVMLWFRPEVIQTVDWGGDPQNKTLAAAEDDSVRLSPRKSFELWRQTVRLTSLPWVPVDHATAEAFVRQLAGAALRQAQSALHVARTLQRGLAPSEIPPIEDLHVAARYRTGGQGEVGGDWYDLLTLPNDRVAVVVGDVAGHGVGAATTMGHLRHAARAYLLEDGDPATALARLNRLAQWILPGEIATVVIAVFPAGRSHVELTSAGHLPPLLLLDGGGSLLDLPRAPALGVTPDPSYVTTSQAFDRNAMLVLYTDGLVERRGEPIDDGLERLRATAAAHGAVDDLCDRLLAGIPEGPHDDDLAVVTVRWAEAA